jgi:hypothetical protein
MTNQAQTAAVQASNAVVRTGITAGGLLIVMMLAALIVTNRIPALEAYALERNAISYILFFLVMLIPVLRFLNQPLKLFAAAMISWTTFAAGYDVTGMVFKNLFDELHRTPLEALLEGMVIYGICAVAVWVVAMVLHARRHPVTEAGHRAVRNSVPHRR